MFFHPNDNKLALIAKHLIAISALFSMLVLSVYVILQSANIKQQEKIVVVDIKNRINICAPEDKKFEEKYFFKF